MAPLERISSDLRAVLASHVAFELMDGRRLRPPHDLQRHGLMSVTAEAPDFEVAVPGIDGVAEARRWLGRSLETEHALVPSDAR
jgi:hypothetical protein